MESDGTEWRHQTTVSSELKRVFFNSWQEESEELRNIFREESEQRILWELVDVSKQFNMARKASALNLLTIFAIA